MKIIDVPNQATQAEQSVIGALLIDNDAIDRIGDLETPHFYNHDHRAYFAEIVRQITAGKRADVLTVAMSLKDEITDCLQYLNKIEQNTPSAANIGRYADMVVNAAIKRSLVALGREIEEIADKPQTAAECVAEVASKVDVLAQRKTKHEPMLAADLMAGYVEVIEARMEGKIKPIATGFKDLDNRLDGGFERGTLTIIAGRPGMGKTAAGLSIGRNVAEWGSALFLSMEMPRDQVSDRNVAALGHIPVKWLKKPTDKGEDGKRNFDAMTHAFQRIGEMSLYIDDQTSLNMLDIRNKCRSVKRRKGLDLLVIDQLSFITGSQEEKKWDAVGEYTRSLLAISKEMNIATVLLCQLNRECEKRGDKRPILADLAMSGSIEQDAANILFLYRDEIYNPDTRDAGVCEVICAKQRQGETGTVALTYIGAQTRFEDLAYRWEPPKKQDSKPARRGFD